MTSRVRTLSPKQGLQEIWQLFVDERCHHVPIVEDERVVGIVSSHDLICTVAEPMSAPAPGQPLPMPIASEVMTTELETIRADEPVENAIDRIGRGDFHALIVVDSRGRLAGIVTHRDLLEYLTR